MDFLNILSTILALTTCACFSYQILYLLLPLFRKTELSGMQQRTRYAILIAARNEEAVLPHLLKSIQAQDYPRELITTYVISDNCTDNTAAVATAHGARVYQRFNNKQIGKGYALNYLLEQIRRDGELDRYDAFLIFDADNLLQKDYVTQINKVCSDGYEVFCGYRNSKNFGTNWISSGHAIWYLHESTHLNQSRMILGNCCAVSGTGFGFTRELLERIGGWNFFTLTEDIEFRTWCATHGVRIGYSHDAVLFDEQPTSLSVSARQRTRWVQGGIQVSLRYALDYLRGIFRGGRTGWASFESATQSIWGYGFSAISYMLRMLVILLASRWLGLAEALLVTAVTAYISLFCVGALTIMTERSRIRATKEELLRALVTYPFYVMTYLPIAVASVFRKPEWKPIAHTVAIGVNEL